MSRGNLLFDRPDLTQKLGKLALYVSGRLATASVDAAYEGRLQINNAIGDCWAELTNGTLPPGASVSVDNATHEVVVAWPAYSETAVPIANGDFELDNTRWARGYGWTIENKGARPGDTSGAKAAAFRGSGESFMEASAFYPLTGIQKSITYGVMIQQGGSSSGNVRAAAALRYYDVDYKLLNTDMGNVVKSGSDGEWKGSGGASTIPGSARYVRPTLWGLRKRQNEPLYADDFTWDLSGVAVGVHNPASYPVTIRVHDAGGRVADWSGTVDARVLRLLGEWKCNDTDMICRDSSGFGNHGSYGASATRNAAPIGPNSSRSVQLTAKGQIGAIVPIKPPYTDFSWLVGDFTLECCCLNEATSGSGWSYPVIRQDSFNFGTAVWAIESNDPGTTMGMEIGGVHVAHAAGTYRTVPMHVVTERIGSIYNTYINGVLKATTVLAGIQNQISQTEFRIGGVGSQGGSYGWKGRVSDVRLYDGAMGADGALARAQLLGFA